MKKLILFLLIFTLIVPTFAYASDTEDKKKLNDFEITNPKEEMTMLPNGNIVLTGNGLDKDKVEIEVYSVKRTITKDKEVIIKKLNNTYTLTIDALKIFAQEIELKDGENLVSINITRGDKKYSIDKTINYNKNMELNKIIRQLDYKEASN